MGVCGWHLLINIYQNCGQIMVDFDVFLMFYCFETFEEYGHSSWAC